jgi:hypothetical protein
MSLVAPCSVGDLLDRITILRLKRSRCPADVIGHVEAELFGLEQAWQTSGPNRSAGLEVPAGPEIVELAAVNLALWDVEDRLRAAEAASRFDTAFIEDARSVYRLNDRRAALKRALNLRLGSGIVEVKIHPEYR